MADADLHEAFKLKAKELMNLIAVRPPASGVLDEVRDLLGQAKALYQSDRVEEALVLIIQAIHKAKKA